jgi:hypothetical protein
MLVTPTQHYQVTFSQYEYLTTVWRQHTQLAPKGPNYRLFCHLLASTLQQYRRLYKPGTGKAGWLSIPATFIQYYYQRSSTSQLVEWQLIDKDDSYSTGAKTKSYRVNQALLSGYLLLDVDESKTYFDLMTGKPWDVIETSQREPSNPPDNTPPIPLLVSQAIASYTHAYINSVAVKQYLASIKPTKASLSDPAFFRYSNDANVWDAILKCPTHLTDKDQICCYVPHYTMQKTGRISTPMQSASRAMKAAAYSGIPNLHNYDLSSSQARITLQALQDKQIPCPWLEEYLSNPSCRAQLAEEAGLPEDKWKEILCALLMGAHLPTNATHPLNLSSAIMDVLREALDTTESKRLVEALKKLRPTLRELTRPLNQWHESLMTEHNASGHIINALGLPSEPNKKNNKGALAAHYLQGQEAYYIHTLTLLGKSYGFEPIGNEHDGLITLGKIPQAAIDEAGQLTGMSYMQLREKPFQPLS